MDQVLDRTASDPMVSGQTVLDRLASDRLALDRVTALDQVADEIE